MRIYTRACARIDVHVYAKYARIIRVCVVRIYLSFTVFERLFKVKKNDVFLFGISFFVLEIFTFLHYANEQSDDVINRSSWTMKHWIKNISRNIGAVFFKLGTRNVHHKRNRVTPSVLLPWQHFRLQYLSVKNQVCPFAILWKGSEVLARNTHGSRIVLTLPITF